MVSDVPEIQAIGADFKEMASRIKTAKAMIALAKDAGEQTAEWEGKLRALIVRKDKWAEALRKRGIEVEEV